jgi:integrase
LPTHQRDAALFAIATGLRQSNVVGVEWSHVDLDAAQACVGADQSKNGNPIAMPLNSTAPTVLRRQIGKHPVKVFTDAGKPIGWANTKAWRDALKRAASRTTAGTACDIPGRRGIASRAPRRTNCNASAAGGHR